VGIAVLICVRQINIQTPRDIGVLACQKPGHGAEAAQGQHDDSTSPIKFMNYNGWIFEASISHLFDSHGQKTASVIGNWRG
jgi:hypothetical protein